MLILTTVCIVNIYTPNTCTALDKVQVVIKSTCQKIQYDHLIDFSQILHRLCKYKIMFIFRLGREGNNDFHMCVHTCHNLFSTDPPKLFGIVLASWMMDFFILG